MEHRRDGIADNSEEDEAEGAGDETADVVSCLVQFISLAENKVALNYSLYHNFTCDRVIRIKNSSLHLYCVCS